jgi:hypothetical protein
MAVSVFRSRKIDFPSGSAGKHLGRHATERCGEFVEQVVVQR